MVTKRDSSIALCVPAFNAAALLPRLFDTVRRQTVPFDELWVYDDASADGTAEVAAQYGARVVQGRVNKGCSAGKNALLMQVGSSWVHFHDADDTLAPEFVERAKARIQRNTFDVLLFNYEQVEEQSGQQMSRSQFEATDVCTAPVRYMLSNTVNNGGVYALDLLRRVGGFDEDSAVRYNEDRAFHLRLAESGAAFEVDPYVGSRFYFNPGSMSSANRVRCLRAHVEITRRFAGRYPEGYEREIGRLAWQDAAGLASFLDWSEADECVRMAIRHGVRIPEESGPLFRSLARVHPLLALRIREHLIRWFKPRFRAGYPA